MWRVVRSLFWLLSYAVVAALAGGSVWVYDRLPLGMMGCEINRRNVTENSQGDMVEAEEEFCDGIANSDTVSLHLILKSSKTPYTFLTYAAGQSEPIVHWDGNDTIVVSLPGTGEVFFKRYYSAGIRIRYQ